MVYRVFNGDLMKEAVQVEIQLKDPKYVEQEMGEELWRNID